MQKPSLKMQASVPMRLLELAGGAVPPSSTKPAVILRSQSRNRAGRSPSFENLVGRIKTTSC